jgi:hypothetical protein
VRKEGRSGSPRPVAGGEAGCTGLGGRRTLETATGEDERKGKGEGRVLVAHRGVFPCGPPTLGSTFEEKVYVTHGLWGGVYFTPEL